MERFAISYSCLQLIFARACGNFPQTQYLLVFVAFHKLSNLAPNRGVAKKARRGGKLNTPPQPWREVFRPMYPSLKSFSKVLRGQYGRERSMTSYV